MQKGLRSLQSRPHHYVRRAGTGAPSLPEAQMSRGNGERGRLLKQAENSALRPPERLRPAGRMTALPDRLSSTRDVWMGKLRPREKRVGQWPSPVDVASAGLHAEGRYQLLLLHVPKLILLVFLKEPERLGVLETCRSLWELGDKLELCPPVPCSSPQCLCRIFPPGPVRARPPCPVSRGLAGAGVPAPSGSTCCREERHGPTGTQPPRGPWAVSAAG